MMTSRHHRAEKISIPDRENISGHSETHLEVETPPWCLFQNFVKKYHNPRTRARKGQIREILPDLYINSHSYEEEDVSRMIKITENRKNVGISLRAGMVTKESKGSILER